MRFGSLFSGFGGIDLGLECAGMECAFQVENDPYCLKVLAKHWPNVTKYKDIREVDFGGVERVDLLAGGFPCQDLSYAGARAGISGKRSGLWQHFAEAIRILRPEYVLVENVPGLLTAGLNVVLGDLASCGYDAEWDCIPAASVGAPHIRDRVFLLAYPAGQRRPLLSESLHVGYDRTQQGTDGEAAKRCEHRELVTLVPGIHPRTPADWWDAQSRMGRSVDGLPEDVDKLRGLGNAVVPQVAQWFGELILEHELREECA